MSSNHKKDVRKSMTRIVCIVLAVLMVGSVLTAAILSQF